MPDQFALIRWNEISSAIAQAQDINDLTKLRAKIETIRILAKQSRQGLETQNKIAEFRLRIDRKRGEWLLENIVMSGNGSNQYEKKVEVSSRFTLASVGVTRAESSVLQRIARIPEDEFERHLRHKQESNEEITTIDLLRFQYSLNFQKQKVERVPDASPKAKCTILFGDNLKIISSFPSDSIHLIYIDPPFNTGKTQKRTSISVKKALYGDRTGYNGERYQTIKIGEKAFADFFDDYLAFLEPRLREAHRILKPNGSLFFHSDYRECHYCKILLDSIFGRSSFINEIIWAFDYGARSKSRWSVKHNNIFWYAKNPDDYQFNLQESDSIPYMAPNLVGEAKAEAGKTPTDTWWNTIVPPGSDEATGYPTQKPLQVIERIVKVHSKPGDLLLDFFAGSGTFGEAAVKNGRDCILVDNNAQAVECMKKRLSKYHTSSYRIPMGDQIEKIILKNERQENRLADA